LRESDRERQLHRFGLWLDGAGTAVGDAELACQSGHAPLHGLDVVGAELRASAVELAVLGRVLQEVLTGSGAEEEQIVQRRMRRIRGLP